MNDVEDSALTDDPKNVLKNLNKISGNDEHLEPETVKRKECYFFKKFGKCKFGVNCNFLHPQGQRGFKVRFQFEKYGSCFYPQTTSQGSHNRTVQDGVYPPPLTSQAIPMLHPLQGGRLYAVRWERTKSSAQENLKG